MKNVCKTANFKSTFSTMTARKFFNEGYDIPEIHDAHRKYKFENFKVLMLFKSNTSSHIRTHDVPASS